MSLSPTATLARELPAMAPSSASLAASNSLRRRTSWSRGSERCTVPARLCSAARCVSASRSRDISSWAVSRSLWASWSCVVRALIRALSRAHAIWLLSAAASASSNSFFFFRRLSSRIVTLAVVHCSSSNRGPLASTGVASLASASLRFASAFSLAASAASAAASRSRHLCVSRCRSASSCSRPSALSPSPFCSSATKPSLFSFSSVVVRRDRSRDANCRLNSVTWALRDSTVALFCAVRSSRSCFTSLSRAAALARSVAAAASASARRWRIEATSAMSSLSRCPRA
mmetsp:Transcript_21563/g.51095  ORF Transcript_21563/g.51095 Transcript_21563/m.51095 type:complete len:287 (-) Transcript_21563:1719-2579(-)